MKWLAVELVDNRLAYTFYKTWNIDLGSPALEIDVEANWQKKRLEEFRA